MVRITRSAKAVSAFLAASALVSPALSVSAQSQEQDAAEEPGVILVTARKVSENLQDVPLAVTAVSGLDMERAAVTEITDVTRTVPNVYFTQSPSNPTSLTLAIRGQQQNDILLTVDPSVGIYIDGLYYPRTHGLRSALVDVARVEVLRGPQGTLYGRNTTGGALSIISNDPTDEFGGSIRAGYGNYNAWEVAGIVNAPLSDSAGLRLVAQHREHDGYGRNFAGEDLADENSTYLRGKLRWELTDTVTATFTGSYNHMRSAGPITKLSGLAAPAAPGAAPGGVATLQVAAELGLLPFTPDNLNQAADAFAAFIGGDPYQSGNLGDTSSRIEGYSLGLTLDAELSDTLMLRSITGYQHMVRENNSDADGTPFDILYATRLTPFDEYISQELQLLGDHDRFSWVAGLYYGREKGHELSPSESLLFLSSTNPSITDADVENVSYAIFAQGTYEITDALRLTLGGRYSWDERELVSRNSAAGLCGVPAPGVEVAVAGSADTQCPRTFSADFSDPSWLASLDYDVTEDILVYAKYARGYRSGGLNIRGRNTAVLFSPFDAETVTEYEVGFKTDLLDRMLQFNVAAFYDDYNNIQRSSSVATGAGPQTFVNNAAEGTIQGIEVEATLRPTRNFTLQASGGHIDAEYDSFVTATGDRTAEGFGIPSWTGSLSATYVHPLDIGDLTFHADTTYRSSVELVPSATSLDQLTQDGYALVNARIALNIEDLGVEVAIFGRNLTDHVYYEAASNLEDILGYNYLITGTPRTYGFSITKRFGAF